jgi:superfamily II DNA or RNA helicase
MLGAPTVQLLEALEIRALENSRLADLLIRRLGPEGLLLNKQVRTELLTALKRAEALQLATELGLSSALDPFEALQAVRFRPKSPGVAALFSFFGIDGAGQAAEDEEPAKLAESTVAASYPLFDYQRKACNEVLGILEAATRPRVLLHMPTGSGKTRTAMNAICQFLRSQFDDDIVVVWVAHSEELCDQASEECGRAWQKIGDRDIRIFRQYGPYRIDSLREVRGGVLIAGMQLLYQQSLSRQSEFLELSRRTRLVVMDEAHQAVAPTYHHLLNFLAPSRKTAILGLSATPGRSLLDAGQDIKLAKFFDRQKVSIQIPGFPSPIAFLQSEGFLAKVEYIPVRASPAKDVQLTKSELADVQLGFDLPARVLENLGNDHLRNLLILRAIMKEADAKRKIIVFGCSVEHAEMLADILRMRGYRASSITSRTPSDVRRKRIAEYRDTDEIQILTNFGVLTTGFDAPRTNVAVITRPTQSVVLYSQMVGRATRGPRANGNAVARVVTVVDSIPGFRSIHEAFTFWEDIWN